MVNINDYRFGFNGKEKDNGWTSSSSSHYDFGARIYDSRIGRWLAIDPLFRIYPMFSPYVFVADNPVKFIDPDGMKFGDPQSESTKRYKKSMKRTKTGRQIYRQLKRSSTIIYIHYVEEASEGNDEKLYYSIENAWGVRYSGQNYEDIINDNEGDYTKYYTFNTETGFWDRNDDSECHIVINTSTIENDQLWMVGLDYTEKDVDIQIHGTEVHEGRHILQKGGYDFTKTIKNDDGTYSDTGDFLLHGERLAEIDARKFGGQAKEELKNQYVSDEEK